MGAGVALFAVTGARADYDAMQDPTAEKALGDSLVRQTRDDGYCTSFWSDLISEDWPDCLMDDALALDELALAR